MNEKHIVVIPGDGIGEEITVAAIEVMKAAATKCNINLTYEKMYAGGAAIDKFGIPLPDETVAACKKAEGVLLGSVGGPKWDNVKAELRAERAILGLRKALGLYANLRPIKIFSALTSKSPLKEELINDVDILILRELTGGIYFGPKQESHFVDGIEQATDLEIYTRPEVERIVRMAFNIAKGRANKVTSVDKSNVLATARMWRRIADEIGKDFSDVTLEHMYADNCAMQLVLQPKQFDVIVTSNLFGDILSDEAAVITGSIGLLPSASLGDGGIGLYEPIHGSAPDIKGRGIANPIGTILSGALLFRHSLNCEKAATMIEEAVEEALLEGYRTMDIYSQGLNRVSTEEMASKIIDGLR